MEILNAKFAAYSIGIILFCCDFIMLSQPFYAVDCHYLKDLFSYFAAMLGPLVLFSGFNP